MPPVNYHNVLAWIGLQAQSIVTSDLRGSAVNGQPSFQIDTNSDFLGFNCCCVFAVPSDSFSGATVRFFLIFFYGNEKGLVRTSHNNRNDGRKTQQRETTREDDRWTCQLAGSKQGG